MKCFRFWAQESILSPGFFVHVRDSTIFCWHYYYVSKSDFISHLVEFLKKYSIGFKRVFIQKAVIPLLW